MTPTPSQRRGFAAFEIEVEITWGRLNCRARTVCLSPKTGLLTMARPRPEPYPGEVGTYTGDVGLAQFREDCFWALEQARGGGRWAT